MARTAVAKTNGDGLDALSPVSNAAASDIALIQPYAVKCEIEGTAALLFHAWNVEAVKEKAGAAKGSKSKKEDNLESYVYRNVEKQVCVPGEYFRQSIVHAAKYIQDPRSPRKSAMDLFKAGLVMLTELAPITVTQGDGPRVATSWDFLDQRRVVIQRNGVNRTRPAFHKGWKAEFELQVILPEYISREILGAAILNAGRLIGIGDFRPSYGRFMTTSYR